MLSDQQVEQFIEEGYVTIPAAFSRDIADQCKELLWQDLDVQRDDPSSWIHPVIRLGEKTDSAFVLSANSETLITAYKQLAHQNWISRTSMGTFPIRFPSKTIPTDIGWHVDASYGVKLEDFMDWRINMFSRGRALLMLFLYSDVNKEDAPTLLQCGSHLEVARTLKAYGHKGLSFLELAEHIPEPSNFQRRAATGEAGTVYLCHPFLVHAAQKHEGTSPRFMAQPPLLSKNDFDITHPLCPIEIAIANGLNAAS